MTDYYLKFNNQQEMWDTLKNLNLAVDITTIDGNTQTVPSGISLDVIGQILKPTGNKIYTDSGLQVDEMAPVDGFHANIRGELTEEQQAQLPTLPAPATPYRVWA